MTPPDALLDVVEVASGRGHRSDPSLPGTGGPAGNAQLTAWLGLVLLVLFAGELLTLLDVRALITWHVVLGVLLLPPALAKTATTGWRAARYYVGDRSYVRAGPPPLLLRLLGPLVVLSTLGLLGSGLLVVLLGRERGEDAWLTVLGQGLSPLSLHQAVFWVWAVATGLHLLARLVPAARLALPGRGSPAGAPARLVVLLVTAATATVAAVLVVGLAHDWGAGGPDERDEGLRGAVVRTR